MKKFLFVIAALALSISSFAFDPVNEKLIRSFQSNFPNASQVTWQELSSTYVVNFVKEGIRARAIFDKDGNLHQVARYYHEKNLPYNVLYRVKRLYPKKNVFGVIEISTANGKDEMRAAYFVKLEDNKRWITVKVTNDGSVAVTEEFLKS